MNGCGSARNGVDFMRAIEFVDINSWVCFSQKPLVTLRLSSRSLFQFSFLFWAVGPDGGCISCEK